MKFAASGRRIGSAIRALTEGPSSCREYDMALLRDRRWPGSSGDTVSGDCLVIDAGRARKVCRAIVDVHSC